MQPEREGLYTFKQAVILGRRALCETSDPGHQIRREGGFIVRRADGSSASSQYECEFCDAIVVVTYPPLTGGHVGG